jgi:hypothetical protein
MTTTTTAATTTTASRAYVLEGTMLEACNCGVLCPCWIGEDPDNGTCDAVIAYNITSGRVGKVDVSGLNFAAAVHIPGNILKGGMRQVVYVDEKATPEQLQALLDAFQGRLGGPLADLAALVGENLGVYQVPIHHGLAEGSGSVDVGDRIRVAATPYKSQYGATTTLRDSIFSTIPGAPAWVSKADEVTVRIPEHGMTWRFEGTNAIQGEFHIEG